MVLGTFHYLITTFALTVYTNSPFAVLLVYYIFQTVWFVVGFDTPDLIHFWGTESLIALLGILTGLAFIYLSKKPKFIRWQAAYVTEWGRFFLWLVLFILFQVPYAVWPIQCDPFVFNSASDPFSPCVHYVWGLILTIVAHVALMGFLWFTCTGSKVFEQYQHLNGMFLMWIIVLAVMEAIYFLQYILAEYWVSIVAAGFILVIELLLGLVCPARVKQVDRIVNPAELA